MPDEPEPKDAPDEVESSERVENADNSAGDTEDAGDAAGAKRPVTADDAVDAGSAHDAEDTGDPWAAQGWESAEQQPPGPDTPHTGPQPYPHYGSYQQGGSYRPPPRPPLPVPPQWLLLAALGAGLLAALLVPVARPGLGVALALGVVGLVVAVVARERATPWSIAFGLVAAALTATVVLRDASWVVWPSLLGAIGLASLSVSGEGRSWFGLLGGGLAALVQAPSVPRFLSASLRGGTARRIIGPVLGGAAAAIVLGVLFGLLFASADPAFAELAGQVLAIDNPETLVFKAFVFVLAVVLVGAWALAALRPVDEPMVERHAGKMHPIAWIIPLGTVNLLFLAFVAIQATLLFGGHDRVQQATGLTYAEYARQGFFQLVVVSVLVLGLVAVAHWLISPRRPVDRLLFSILLGVLCVLTVVVLASAMHRLDLYTDTFGLTRLRAAVMAAILWIGSIFVLVLAAGFREALGRGVAWLPRAAALATGVGLLLFGLWNPDARIAESQESRSVEAVDAWYMGTLSADAVPALEELPEPARSCALDEVDTRLAEDPWNAWNLARHRARELVDEASRRNQNLTDCPTGRWDGDMSNTRDEY